MLPPQNGYRNATRGYQGLLAATRATNLLLICLPQNQCFGTKYVISGVELHQWGVGGMRAAACGCGGGAAARSSGSASASGTAGRAGLRAHAWAAAAAAAAGHGRTCAPCPGMRVRGARARGAA